MLWREFDWDEGNQSKIKSRFSIEDVEQFFAQDLYVIHDTAHSKNEDRMIAVGQGPNNKPMFVCYTLRGSKIRVISARYMSIKEAKRYEAFKEKDQK